jgi:hypothetical protein
VMAISEDHIRRAVDEILDPAWARERRRAAWRMSRTTLGRVIPGLLVLWVVAIVAHLVLAVNIPWVFFGVLAFVGTTLAALVDWDDHTVPRD